MNGWVAAALLLVLGLVAFQWQQARNSAAVENMRQAIALLEAELAAAEVNRKYDDIDKELMNGGEDDLSPYMRGAGERLWGTP